MTSTVQWRPVGRRPAFAGRCAGLWIAVGMFAALAGPASAADPATIDWSKIPAKKIVLFYPGQSTYDWLKTADHKKGNTQVPQGKSCVTCHEGDEADMGKNIVKGGPLEPHPVAGKQGSIELAVQAAHDAQNLYMRFQWKTKQPYPGSAYPYYRYDGKAWKKVGWPQLDKEVWDEKKPAIYEDRLTLMVDDGKVPLFKEQGCWLTCHDGMRDTPNEVKASDVKAHALLGAALKQSDVRKYLPSTRTDKEASWDKTKPAEEIAKLKADGQFVDLWQWRANRSNPVGMADDGYVLEYRLFDEGKNPWGSNFDAAANQPKYMWDAKKVGFKAHTMDMIRDASKPSALVVEENAVAFDPAAGWKEGDLLPQNFVSRKIAAGSASDNQDAKGTWKDGTWTVVWTRKLDTGHPADDKILKVGGKYTIGYAVHDDNITTRGHHVSLPTTLGIGTDGDVKAVTLP